MPSSASKREQFRASRDDLSICASITQSPPAHADARRPSAFPSLAYADARRRLGQVRFRSTAIRKQNVFVTELGPELRQHCRDMGIICLHAQSPERHSHPAVAAFLRRKHDAGPFMRTWRLFWRSSSSLVRSPPSRAARAAFPVAVTQMQFATNGPLYFSEHLLL